MIELTWIPAAIRGLFWLYVALGVASLIAALLRPKTLGSKAGWTLAVVVIFGTLPLLFARGFHEDKKVAQVGQERLRAATTLFETRCKSAGEKINRTVENVDGVVWMKWRPKEANVDDQFALSDPYGHDCYGDECIKRLLRVAKGSELNPEDARQHVTGYRFVETVDPTDGKHYRYFGVIKSVATRTPDEIEQYKKNTGRNPGPDVYGLARDREAIQQFTARYGVTWDDISTHEDREQWVAGSSLKAIDLQTNEVIAERVGYLVDKGLGSQAGFRSPWPMARAWACPTTNSERTTWTFATKVMRPTKQGE